MALAVKAMTLVLCWGGICLGLFRAFGGARRTVLSGTLAGFAGGAVLVVALAAAVPATALAATLRGVLAVGFLLLGGVAVTHLYRPAGATLDISGPAAVPPGRWPAVLTSAAAGLVTAAVGGGVLGALPLGPDRLLPGAITLAIGLTLPFLAVAGERRLPVALLLTGEALLALVVGLLLLLSSSSLGLDLFAPLSMKVMKLIHDFIHQFFESMLIPDHPFFRNDVWTYIGYLFSNSVGFWGGLALWLLPPLLLVLGLLRKPLPSVAHIRQGAQRRKLLASFLRARRWQLVVPWLTVLVLAGAVYRSTHPATEYWDPKPVPVSAGADGTVVLPVKDGERDLDDGRIHKFALRDGEQEARFLVVMKPDGRYAVALDACAICQPEGYGQAEGTVICYYCKTLIPLETVGQPGGCNPVPIRFTASEREIRVARQELVNAWVSTVQAGARVPGGKR